MTRLVQTGSNFQDLKFLKSPLKSQQLNYYTVFQWKIKNFSFWNQIGSNRWNFSNLENLNVTNKSLIIDFVTVQNSLKYKNF